MSGLLVNGTLYPVAGVTIIGPHETAWAHLNAGDGIPRTRWPSMWTLHKTIADDPEHVLPGAGPAGGAQATAEYWAGDPKHSGAQIVAGHDGIVACLADLVLFEAWHARSVNLYSVGVETKEVVGGGVYQAALDATVAVTLAGVELLGIQLQVPKKYSGKPLACMAHPETMVGVFGHRDNDDDRGKWDPGEILFQMLRDRGAESYDFDVGEDRDVWRMRQTDLNVKGYRLVVDGVPGPATTAALKAEGYRGGVFALGKS